MIRTKDAPVARRLAAPLALGLLLVVAPAVRAADDLPPEGQFAPEAWVAADDGVPVRSEPGFVYREVSHLRDGQEVLVDARQGQWLHVRPEGWVFVDHLVRPDAKPAAAAERRVRVLKEGSRVRKGPGTEHPVVDTLSAGQLVRIQGVEGDWWVLGPDRYLFRSLAEEADASVGTSSAGPTAPVGNGERRRWTLMDLNGVIFEVSEFSPANDFVPALRKEMRNTGLLEDDWTFMRLMIMVPDGPFRFNYSPEQNTVVVTDVRGERYGNVYTRGPVERLPVHLRQFFLGASVPPGQRFEGVLLFRPTLQTGAIDEVQMFIGGRLQTLYQSPST